MRFFGSAILGLCCVIFSQAFAGERYLDRQFENDPGSKSKLVITHLSESDVKSEFAEEFELRDHHWGIPGSNKVRLEDGTLVISLFCYAPSEEQRSMEHHREEVGKSARALGRGIIQSWNSRKECEIRRFVGIEIRDFRRDGYMPDWDEDGAQIFKPAFTVEFSVLVARK